MAKGTRRNSSKVARQPKPCNCRRDKGKHVNTLPALNRIHAVRKTGKECFRNGTTILNFDLLSFWQWSCSDLIGNTARGVLAEFIVARAMGIADGVRDGWAFCDLITPEGIKVEVKSAAYLQSWFQSKLSGIFFRTPKTRAWSPETNRLAVDAARHADAYVFAVLAHQDKNTVDPMDLAQWEFYVVPTKVLNERKRSQHSITLKSLRALSDAVPYEGLRDAVLKANSTRRCRKG